jgi:FkbM family methyltransferase
MGPLQRVWKPWFIYRPVQVLSRVRDAGATPRLGEPLRTAWGMNLHADPTRDIGRSIVTTGVFDLAVSEVLARLVDPGARVIDAGANVGYMTLLGAVAAGSGGRIVAFEPHPDLFSVLERNVADAPGSDRLAGVDLHHSALGDRDGEARLLLPPEFGANDGLARIVAEAEPDDRTVTVRMQRLDDVLDGGRADVLKLDVEGHESQVLMGAVRALQAHRVRHVIFEEHDVAVSESVRILHDAGYAVFALGWSLRRLRLAPVGSVALSRPYEAPSFVATIDPDGLLSRCLAPGWRVLRPWLGAA